MVVGGLPERNNIHAECVANQALDMMHYCQQVKRPDNDENIVVSWERERARGSRACAYLEWVGVCNFFILRSRGTCVECMRSYLPVSWKSGLFSWVHPGAACPWRHAQWLQKGQWALNWGTLDRRWQVASSLCSIDVGWSSADHSCLAKFIEFLVCWCFGE